MSAINRENKVITCCHQNISAALNSCFSKGHYKHLNLDGTFTVVEFPADQYKSAYVNMQNYIKQGEVFGIFNPLLAGQMFKSSRFTYEQIKNIALSGLIDKLTVNMETGEITSPSEIGISPVIAQALQRMDKKFFSVSDLNEQYECLKDIWKAEKIKSGFLFKKEVELVEDLQVVDTKCMNILKKFAFDYLLSRAEIEDIVTEIKSKKYIEFLKNVIDDPDCDEKITAKIEVLVKDAVDDRKKYGFSSLYRKALKAYGEKVNEEDADTVAIKFAKRISAILLVLLGYYSFFDANFLESKLRPINDFATKILVNQSERFDKLYNSVCVDTDGEFPVVISVFEKIKSAVMTAKVAFSAYDLVLDFGSRIFFNFLIPLTLVFCSLYFALGCKKAVAVKTLKFARIFFVFAIMLRFFTPVNSYFTVKANEYIFNNRYTENEKLIKLFAVKYDKSEKDIKRTVKDQSELADDIVRSSGEAVSVILIQSLLIPVIVFIAMKMILCLL